LKHETILKAHYIKNYEQLSWYEAGGRSSMHYVMYKASHNTGDQFTYQMSGFVKHHIHIFKSWTCQTNV